MPYAEKTKVSVDRTIEQIRKVLEAHGANGFAYMSDRENDLEQIAFRVRASDGVTIHVNYKLPVPSLNEFTKTERGRARAANVAIDTWEQAVRSLWRLAYMSIKTKLEMTKRGLTVVEREFFYDVVVPGTGGQTVGEVIEPQVKRYYREGLGGGPARLELPSPKGGDSR